MSFIVMMLWQYSRLLLPPINYCCPCFVVCFLLFALCRLFLCCPCSAVCSLLYAVFCLLSTVYCQLFAVCSHLSVVCSSVFWCLLSAFCRLVILFLVSALGFLSSAHPFSSVCSQLSVVCSSAFCCPVAKMRPIFRNIPSEKKYAKSEIVIDLVKKRNRYGQFHFYEVNNIWAKRGHVSFFCVFNLIFFSFCIGHHDPSSISQFCSC